MIDEDLQALEALIRDQPEKGAVMQGTGGLRKLRFAPPSWHSGKSGATRDLFNIFAKNEQPDLSAAEKAEARKAVNELREIHRRK